MTIVFRGGTSGNREDSIASMPGATSQPVSKTGSATGKNPGVNFDGATSGNREDAKPNVSVGFDPQVPQETSSDKSYPDVQWCQNTANREGLAPPPVPSCGTPDDSAT